MINIGIRSSIINAPFREDSLTLLADTGFSAIELSFNAPNKHLDYSDKVLGRKIQKRAGQLNLKILAHAPYRLPITCPDNTTVNTAVEEYLQVLNGIKYFGARRLVIHACIGKENKISKKTIRMNNLIQALRLLEQVCSKNKIELAVETMIPGRLTSNLDTLIKAVDEIDSPWVGICLDTNHVNLTCSIAKAVIKAGRRINEIHANDNHGIKEEHLLPYLGAIDWKAVAKAIKKACFQGDIVMEPNHHKDKDDREMLAYSYAQAKRLLDEINRCP